MSPIDSLFDPTTDAGTNAKPHVVIIGGGLAGLTAALHLTARGVRITLLESGTRIGGRLSGSDPVTFDQDGVTYTFAAEHGIHGVWGQYNNLRAMLEQFRLTPRFVQAHEEAWIMRAYGKAKIQWARGGSALRYSWTPAPLHYLALFLRPRFLQMLTLRDLASMFRVLGGLIFATAYDPASEADNVKLNRLTLADFFRGWSPTLQALFIGLARNFTSAQPEEVPQTGFIAFLRFYTLLRRDSWRFSYFDRDSDTALIQPLIHKICEQSPASQILTGAAVTTATRHGDISYTRNELAQTISADQIDHIIFALDVPGMRAVLDNSPDFSAASHAVQYPLAVPTVILRYWFKVKPQGGLAQPEAGIFSGDFTLDNYFWLHRFQSAFTTWSDSTGGSAAECHIYGPPSILAEPDAVLFARGLTDLIKTWPDLRGTLITQSIRRNPPTHSLFPAQSAPDQLDVTLAALFNPSESKDQDRFSACGDWINYPHAALYMERATVTGIAAANRALAHIGAQSDPHPDPQSDRTPQPIRPVDPPEPLARGFEIMLRGLRRTVRRRKPRPIR